MYKAIDSSFSEKDSRFVINTQGLFRKYLKYDSIPVTYTPTSSDRSRKQSLLYQQDEAVIDRIGDVITQLKYYFGSKSNNLWANNNFLALYEMLYVDNVGKFLSKDDDPALNHAAYYDHGHKSSASLLYSGMNRYAQVDTYSIANELKNYDKPREMEKMITDLGNMEFMLNMIGMCEYITAAFQQKIEFYERQGDYEAYMSIKALKSQRDGIIEHITDLTNKYLLDIKKGNQRTYPCISPDSEISFTMLTREMGRVNYNFEKPNSNTGGLYDLDHLYACLAPLLNCQDLNRLGPNNPYCSMYSYKQQLARAKEVYYGNDKTSSTKIGTKSVSSTTPQNSDDGNMFEGM